MAARKKTQQKKSTRRQLRRRELGPIPAAFSTPNIKAKGHVWKLSRKGLFFATDRLPKPGVRVRVVFNDPDGNKISIGGSVRWNTAQLPPKVSGFGMEVEGRPQDYLEFYEDLLTR
jgi:hypothetical protein